VKTVPYKIDFDSIAWESSIPGMRQKVVKHGSKQIRLVEYSKDMVPHWCKKGHFGYVLEGLFEIEFDGGAHRFKTGDGVLIPDGSDHMHQGRIMSDSVRVIFVEDV